MKNILILGAGKSSSYLIKYFADISWPGKITVADLNPEGVRKIIGNHPAFSLVTHNIEEKEKTHNLITSHDIVISMLPAFLHIKIAQHCVELGKHLLTASYLSEEMKKMEKEIKSKGLVFLNEMGLDPGIDHMTAMNVIDEIRAQGGKMREFETFTGGLLAPECEKDNPWRYKFTWNPRNVVLAGAGGAVKFIQEGQYKYIPYHRLFRRTEVIKIPGLGQFVGYANRDSLKYRELYKLEDIKTLYRGTLRRPGFCRAWDILVQLGMTDDSYVMEDSENLTYRQFTNSFLAYHPTDRVELKLMHYLNIQQDDEEIMEKLQWLDLFNDEKKVGIKNATPAMILQHILEQKWTMQENDKDMVVMWHRFAYYDENGVLKEKQASMHAIGENMTYTAMAKTVGLPLAIAARMLAENKIKNTGLLLPMEKSIYKPIIEELYKFGITFQEWVVR